MAWASTFSVTEASLPFPQAESYKKKATPKEDISLSTMEFSGVVVKQGYLSKQVGEGQVSALGRRHS